MSTTDTSKNYSPTFVGNGYLAARVSAAGEGFSSTPITTQSELAGFYASTDSGKNEERAALPTWTTLGFGRSGGVYGIGKWSCKFGQLCPAAYGQISGGAFVENSHSGGIVGGYLAGLNNGGQPTVGGTDVIPISNAPAGQATLAVRYANGSGGPQTFHLDVNGTLQQLSVPDTGGWDSWGVMNVPVTLNGGANTLKIVVEQGDEARVNVDYLALYPDGSQPPTAIAPATVGTSSKYKQSLDVRTGVLSTSFDWTSPDGDTTSLDYEVNANRADGHLGTVSVRAVPHWSGTATVTDEFDGRGLNRASTSNPGVDGKTATLSANVVTDGKLVTAGLNSVLRINDEAVPTKAVSATDDGTVGQSADFAVTTGQTYEITKYVGVASSVDTDRQLQAATPQQYAADTAARAAGNGYQQARARNDKAMSRLWQSDISIPGDSAMTAEIRASMYYLLASMRAGVDWSTSPGGLSSDGYSGHVFWDMETWMYPALLAQYPDIARGADTYRQKLLSAAKAEAAKMSTAEHPINGAKYPWQSALTGKETTPDWATEGKQEIHISADVALAQWQYYQASGDTAWLRDKAWPVLKNIADYWATRAVPDAAGGYDINDVKGPDEYHDNVNNSVTTNAGAQTSLRIAVQAAGILGQTADPDWSKVADGLKIPVDTTAGIHPEYDGYNGQTIKQADVTLLQYPWAVPMLSSLAQSDLDYYTAHTDPNGPSMTDAIAAIDGASLGSPGCQVYSYMQNSAKPYLAAPFNQWYETRSGGAFTFTTGEGGYLQEFLYGFTGLRWGTDAVTVNPFLPPQLPGVNLTGVKWHGRTFDISVGQQTTQLTLRSGPPLPVRVGSSGVRQVAPGSALQIPTRHPASTAQPSSCAGPITSAAASSRCADIHWGDSSDGTPLDLYDCNGTAAQSWTRPGNGTVTAMGKCMDVSGGSSADGTPVQIYTCNGSASQQWTYDQSTGELQALGKCLATSGGGTSNGTSLVIDTCDGSTSQQWHLPS
ncbi:ricin-type beta-trefoil lectin domain protein [Streptomyces sp. NPDC051976]|uniref:ricin-type beta-trefoil lectin domain protein n=1 Tax=Streptomyces sp. NPDC051976 TaxID=3154947 RepID=UPI00343320CA